MLSRWFSRDFGDVPVSFFFAGPAAVFGIDLACPDVGELFSERRFELDGRKAAGRWSRSPAAIEALCREMRRSVPRRTWDRARATREVTP
jgi:hypothetical protein